MKRLDQWLVEEGHYPSRERARLAVMAGEVEVEGRGRALKAGYRVAPGDRVVVRKRARFVSRGGDKLDAVLERWQIEVGGRMALDAGASTGGFTHCLLQRGASRVICIDVGKGQLHWDLRRDERITVMEGRNVRFILPADLPYEPDLIVADLSFISLRLVLAKLVMVLAPEGELIALIKPQFEAGRGKVGRKGVVRDPEVHREVLRGVLQAAKGHGVELEGVAPSSPRGADGNLEFFAWWTRRARPGKAGVDAMIEAAMEEAWKKE